MNNTIYQRLRTYLMNDLEEYINGSEYDTTRRMLSKLAKGESLGRMEHEKQRAYHLFQCHDLTPRERAASHLLGLITSYRMIAWFREAAPPNGHQQLPALEEIEDNEWKRETRDSLIAYICYLPEREASALLSAWETESCRHVTYHANPKSISQLERECAAPLSSWTGTSEAKSEAFPVTTQDDKSTEEEFAQLFDPVPVESLEKMFPSNGKWKLWAEKAKTTGLICARVARAKFNPYLAGVWFIRKGIEGWDESRLNRTLANNLPERSRDHKHLLTGNID